MLRRTLVLVGFSVSTCCWSAAGLPADLLVGTASTDITPTEPVALAGQFHLRIAQGAETPITASVVALQSRHDDRSLDTAILVSCDLVCIPTEVLGLVRRRVHQRVPDLDTQKIFLAATHTHTAPVLRTDKYRIPKQGVIGVEAYRAFLADRVADAVAEAWNRRAPGAVTWGLGHAVVAYNRRAVYADGSARMYGRTNLPEFRHLEGYEDHDIGTLFFWELQSGADATRAGERAGRLIGVAVNVACPAQEVESRTALNADFWHPVRKALRKRYGEQLSVLGWSGAAGDQSPHLMYREAAEQRMRRLRGLTRLEEIARRIVRAVDDAYQAVEGDRHADVPLIHEVRTIRLPVRLVTESEYAEATAASRQAAAQIEKDPKAAARQYRRMQWYQATVRRYEKQRADPKLAYAMELHVVRIGDAVVCTNPFELFTDYGIRIKARSKAVQTFVVQLVGPGSYLPTEKAVRGGGYSAVVHSSLVGPEGGQVLVDRTVELINSMWTP